jgi:K+-transporting ATPase A subunit
MFLRNRRCKMKNAYKNILIQPACMALATFVTLAALVAFAACKNPTEDATGTITISLGSAANGNGYHHH